MTGMNIPALAHEINAKWHDCLRDVEAALPLADCPSDECVVEIIERHMKEENGAK